MTQLGVRALAAAFLALSALARSSPRAARCRASCRSARSTRPRCSSAVARRGRDRRARVPAARPGVALRRARADLRRAACATASRAWSSARRCGLEPNAPDFIGPYCRGVTALWAVVFLLNALGIAALALFAPPAWWRAYTGWIVWLVFGALSLVEFVVRKRTSASTTAARSTAPVAFFFPSDEQRDGPPRERAPPRDAVGAGASATMTGGARRGKAAPPALRSASPRCARLRRLRPSARAASRWAFHATPSQVRPGGTCSACPGSLV